MAATTTLRWLPGLRQRAPTLPGPEAESVHAPDPARFDPADFDPPLRTRLLILQPTPFCNIDCSYCYLPERSNPARMSLATVRQAAQALRRDGLLGPALTVVWHAGEPLVLPPSWYEAAFTVLDEELGGHTALSHSMQTNATLIGDAWCAFFQRRAVRVGVSVDGPADLHDRHRRTRSGAGTHAAVLRGMACLRAHGIAFHAIAVVTRHALEHADAFFDFFEAQQVAELGCNFDEAEGLHAQSSLAGCDDAYRRFIGRLLERSLAPGAPRVRELANAWQLIAAPLAQQRWRGEAWPDNAQNLPFALLSVAHDGSFATFSPELLGQPAPDYANFTIGRVGAGSLLDAASRSAPFTRLWHDVLEGMRACRRECAYFGHCGGGAPANKFYENGSIASAATLYCRTMLQAPFDAVLARLEREAPERCAAPGAM